MAKIFGQLEKAQLENTTADVGSLPKGMITYRTDLNLAKVSNGTSMLSLIDESSTQTLTGKSLTNPTFTSSGIFTEITTPSTPSAGLRKIYAKSDGFYQLNSLGVESSFSGGGGLNTTLSNATSPVAFNQNFTPDITATRAIGDPLKTWTQFYGADLVLSSGAVRNPAASQIYVDFTNRTLNSTTGAIFQWGNTGFDILPEGLPIRWNDGNAPFYTTSLLASATPTTNVTFRIPPSNGSAGQFLRTDGNGLLTYVSPVFVFAQNSSGQGFNNGVQANITNWTEITDNFAAFDATGGFFDVPTGEAGVYLISVQIAWADTTSAGDRVVYILKNGTIIQQHIRSYETRAAGQNHQTVTVLLSLAAADRIRIAGIQSSGGTQNLSASALSNSLSIAKIGVL